MRKKYLSPIIAIIGNDCDILTTSAQGDDNIVDWFEGEQ